MTATPPIQQLATQVRDRYPEILVREQPSGIDVYLQREPTPMVIATVVLVRDEIQVRSVGTAQRPVCCPVDGVDRALDAVSAIIDAYVTDEYEPSVHAL